MNDDMILKVNGDIDLIQKKNGLYFGTDALLLAAFIKKSKKSIALDYGSGSGIISMLCAKKNKLKHIYAVEIQNEYYEIIKQNIKINDLDDVITPVFADIKNINIESDIIFTNPPYMKIDSGEKNKRFYKYIARHEVFGDINLFCAAAAASIKCGGLFYIVYRPDRMIDLLCAMRKNDIEPKRLLTVYQDIYHKPSFILVEGKKNAMPSLTTPKPFIMYDGNKITKELAYIYENGDFDEQFI